MINGRLLFVLLFAVVVQVVISQDAMTETINKACKNGDSMKLLNTCLKNNLKDPKNERKIAQMAGKKYKNAKQIHDTLCNTESPESKKLVSTLLKLIAEKYDTIKLYFKNDPAACVMKIVQG